jgi:hypothetical protein
MSIDPVLLPAVIRAEISAMYANAFNSCEDVGPGERIDIDQAWQDFGQATWEETFGAAYPNGDDLSLETARQGVADDLAYWCEE